MGYLERHRERFPIRLPDGAPRAYGTPAPPAGAPSENQDVFLQGTAYKTYETPEPPTEPPISRTYSFEEPPTKPTEPREPGSDDNRPTSPVWLAEYEGLLPIDPSREIRRWRPGRTRNGSSGGSEPTHLRTRA